MKTAYAIAYSEKDGRNFCGTLPWILDDFSSENECLENAQRLIKEGYMNVIPFHFESKRKKNEEFDWEYVRANRIEG